jgi:hypothetical protein
MVDPVYILIRTSGRPNFFNSMMETIKNQTYENIITIVHSDDPRDEYVKGDIIINGTAFSPNYGNGPYNLYNNRLLKSIPKKSGWFHFIDDDDEYYSDDVIEKLVKNSKRDHVNVGRVKRWNETIWPKHWRNQKSFQTECFFIHTDYKKIGKWWGNKGGDHHYSKQLTKILPINWIEDLIICKAQEGKGHGRKFDKGGKKQDNSNKFKPDKEVAVICLCRNRNSKKSDNFNLGELKYMKYGKALELEKEDKVKITHYNTYLEKPLPLNLYNL